MGNENGGLIVPGGRRPGHTPAADSPGSSLGFSFLISPVKRQVAVAAIEQPFNVF
jgi:hypothetical protein